MHRPAACRTGSASGNTGARRISARTTRTLENRPSALDGARSGRRTGAARSCGTRRRRAVDRTGSRLRHDDALDRRGRSCAHFWRLRRDCNRRSRWRWRRNRRRSSGSGDRRGCRYGRMGHYRVCRRSRRNCGTWRCYRSRRSCRHRRTRHHRAGRRFGGNGRRLLYRGRDNRRRLARLRHDAARRGRLRLGRRGRSARCSRSCCGLCHGCRRCRRLGHGWRRGRSTRRAGCLFFPLLNRLQDVARLRHLRPVNLLRCRALALGRRRTAIPAASPLEVRAHTLRFVRLERAGVRLRVRHPYFLQHVQNGFALDLELSC